MNASDLKKEIEEKSLTLRIKKARMVKAVILRAIKNNIKVVLLCDSEHEYKVEAWKYWKSLGFPRGKSKLTGAGSNLPGTQRRHYLSVPLHEAWGCL